MRLRFVFAGIGAVAGFGLAAAAAAPVDGQQVFTANCAACHQATGLGRPPVFPALKADPLVLGPKGPLVALVLNGRGAMPGWKTQLSDAQVAAATSYIRASWGNKAAPVAPAEVAAVRSGGKAH
jgi:mono/diheme cytochrome c family protein